MDWVIVLLFICLVLSFALIGLTLVSLPKLGDERKKRIKMEAQSYTFTVIIGLLLLKIIGQMYRTLWKNGEYEGIDPFVLLLVISIVYLVALQVSKKKYGD